MLKFEHGTQGVELGRRRGCHAIEDVGERLCRKVVGVVQSRDDSFKVGDSYFDVFMRNGCKGEASDDGLESTFGFMRVVLNLVEGQFDERCSTLLGRGKFRVLLKYFIMEIIRQGFEKPGGKPYTGNLVNRINVSVHKFLPLKNNNIVKLFMIGEEICVGARECASRE